LKSFYGWAVVTGRLGKSPAAALPAVGVTPPNPRPVPPPVLDDAIAAADCRVRLMIRLGVELGLRRGEVAGVRREDLFEDLLGWSLTVHGKGGKDRAVPVPDALAKVVLESDPGFLFPGRAGGHLSAKWVGKLVSRLMPAGWTMHTLRHRFATKAWGVNPDLATIQELMGHASPATTRVYIRVSDEAKRRIVEAVAA
jgi:integrase